MPHPSEPESHSLLTMVRRLAQERRWPELARAYDSTPDDEIARSPELEYLFADALRRVGRMEPALDLAIRADAGAARIGDRRLILRSINLLGMLDFEAGVLSGAGARFDMLLERAAEWGDDEFAARASNNLGVLASVRGERELAMTFYQRAMAAYHRLGHTRGLAQTSHNLGLAYRDLGFPEDAEQHFDKAIRYAELADSEDVVALAETERAYLRAESGDGDLAESLAERALRRHGRMEDPGGIANATRVLAAAAEARGDVALALARLEQALAIADAHPDPLLRAEIQRQRGRMLLATGQPLAARTALAEAADAFGALGAVVEARAVADLLSRLLSPDTPEPLTPG